MSLCVVLRSHEGEILMATDTALSTTVGGKSYRVSDWEDDDKIIEHNSALVFCSGEQEKCKLIRNQIRNMKTLNLMEVQAYAQLLFRHNNTDNSTGILTVWPDGNMVGMLSAQDFKLTPIPWTSRPGQIDIFALGFKMEDVYKLSNKYVTQNGINLQVVAGIYNELLCEEVGGRLHTWFRTKKNEPYQTATESFEEPDNIRRITKLEAIRRIEEEKRRGEKLYKLNSLGRPTWMQVPFSCIVKAQDFLLNSGGSMVSILNEQGKIKGDYIDAKGINIKDPTTGDTVLYMDTTGIHWAAKYSPIKYQYATSASGPWHDTRSANEEYRRESTDGGTTWSDGIKFVARDGRNGSDASVTYDNIKKALQKAEGIQTSFITVDEMGAPNIYGGNIYGGTINGGKITALDKMEADCDFYVGNNVYIGHQSASAKSIIFNDTSRINIGAGDFAELSISTPKMTISAFGASGSNFTIKTPLLDLSQVTDIDWGNNAPKAVFA